MKRAVLTSLVALVVGLPVGFVWIVINFLDFTADGLVAGVAVYGLCGLVLGRFFKNYWYLSVLVIWIPVVLAVPAFNSETFGKAFFVLATTAGPAVVAAYASHLSNRLRTPHLG